MSMLCEGEFSQRFWALKDWVQNGTYPEWPYAVYQFIIQYGIKRIIEVGVGTGAVSVAIALTQPEIQIGIDDERENNFLRDANKLVHKWHPIRGLSSEVLPALRGHYDLLIHDGEHSYKSVREDCYEAVRLGVRYIIVHDSDWPEVDDAIHYLHMPNRMLLGHSGFPRVIEVPCKALR